MSESGLLIALFSVLFTLFVVLTERKLLEQQVAGVIQKRSRNQYEPVQQTVHAASVKKARVAPQETNSAINPFAFRRNTMSNSMRKVKDDAPQLFAALSNFSGGSVKSNMDSLFKMRNNI